MRPVAKRPTLGGRENLHLDRQARHSYIMPVGLDSPDRTFHISRAWQSLFEWMQTSWFNLCVCVFVSSIGRNKLERVVRLLVLNPLANRLPISLSLSLSRRRSHRERTLNTPRLTRTQTSALTRTHLNAQQPAASASSSASSFLVVVVFVIVVVVLIFGIRARWQPVLALGGSRHWRGAATNDRAPAIEEDAVVPTRCHSVRLRLASPALGGALPRLARQRVGPPNSQPASQPVGRRSSALQKLASRPSQSRSATATCRRRQQKWHN